MNHPPLFKKTGTGAIQTWLIGVEGSTIVTTWGQVGGAMQTTRDVIQKGKNPGKKNATTPEQQAALQAEADWTKKLKKGYVQTLDDAMAGAVDDIIAGGILPMLAHKFADFAKKIAYPCFTQPKLDGHRCEGVVSEMNIVTLWTRTRKQIHSMPHIVKAIQALNLPAGTILDGELYSHTHKAQFSKLTSLIRGSKPKPEGAIVEYHIYDLASHPGTFAERTVALAKLLSSEDGKDSTPLIFVETVSVDSEEALKAKFTEFVEAGYEGSMARNSAGKYVNSRSFDLQKVKAFKEGDFTVVGIEEGKGKLAGHVGAFVFKAENGEEFRAKMKGETSLLKGYFEDPASVIGKVVEVHYFELSEYGIPRFPVAHRFKEVL